MATLNLGRIKPVFRGAYSGGTAYVVDDIVTHGNESFICIQAHGAGTQATSVTAYWTKLAAKGTDGTDVGTTITTQGDVLYRDGSGLQRLAKPASNKFLQNTSGGVLSWETVVSKVVKVTYLEGSTRVVTASQSGDQTVIAAWGSVVKDSDAATSDLYFSAHIPTRNHGNDNSAHDLVFTHSDTSVVQFDTSILYSSGSSSHSIIQCGSWKLAGLKAGTWAVSVVLTGQGTSTNGGHVYNPTSTDNSRLPGTNHSRFTAFEITI